MRQDREELEVELKYPGSTIKARYEMEVGGEPQVDLKSLKDGGMPGLHVENQRSVYCCQSCDTPGQEIPLIFYGS